MLTGGRVLGHLRDLIDDPAAVLLFVGYQGVGTLGARLQAGAKSVRIEGRELPVRCRIRSISGFSAHADEPERRRAALVDVAADLRPLLEGHAPRPAVGREPEAAQERLAALLNRH